MSLVRRLERFLGNGAVQVRQWYQPIACEIVVAASVTGAIHLVLDTTKISAHHRLLMVGVAYRRRVLPLAWTWVRTSRGHSTVHKQVALLSYVRTLIPAGIQVSLVGDCEFGHTAVLPAMHTWHWDYALRQSGHRLAQLANALDGVRLDSLIAKRGDCCFIAASSSRRRMPSPPILGSAGINAILNRGCWQPTSPAPALFGGCIIGALGLKTGLAT